MSACCAPPRVVATQVGFVNMGEQPERLYPAGDAEWRGVGGWVGATAWIDKHKVSAKRHKQSGAEGAPAGQEVQNSGVINDWAR